MKIKIGDFEFTEVWDGVLYKKLSHYPDITDWELKNIIDFIDYESSYNRSCEIECDNKALISVIDNAIANKNSFKYILPPKLIT